MLKKIASILAGTALLIGGVAVGSNLTDSPAPLRTQATASALSPVEYSGAIRCENGSWSAINDSGHTSVGIGNITMTSTYVQVAHTHVDKVNLAMYGGDNDYPANGYVITGASGGLDFDRFYIMKNGSVIDPRTACGIAYTNVWVNGKGFVEAP